MTRCRTVLAGLALAAVAAIAGCLDALVPGPPPATARLGIVPLFDETANRSALPGDIDSIVVTIHNPPAPDIVVGQRIAPGQDSIVIAVEVPLANGVADTVTLDFDAIRSQDGAVLYHGSQDIPVRVGVLSQADSVHVLYVGPGQNLQSITVTPNAVALRPGDSVAFNVLSIDSTGATVVGMPVLFLSRSPAVATVTQAGTAHGVGDGRTYVIATSGARASVRDSASVVVSRSAVAVIGLSPDAVSFSGVQGGANPAAQTVTVTNAGLGSLTGLGVSGATYAAGERTGWLGATLSQPSAPATLTVQATTGALAPGTYHATVSLVAATASNNPQTLAVTFTVVAGPAIGLSATVATFTDTIGTGDPASQEIAVSNTGNGTLTGLAVGPIGYGTGPTGWLTATLQPTTAPATLTLNAAKGSLAAGIYTATVPVTSGGASNSPRTVTVTFDLRLAPLVALQVTPGFRVMLPGDTMPLQVSAKDGAGNPATPAGLRFLSRAPGVARVDSVTGLVTGVAPGTAVVVASAPGASGSVRDSLLVAIPASGQAVAFAITNGRSFASAQVGDSLPIVIGVDLRAVPAERLGSYNAQLDWAPSVATFEVIGALAVNGFVAPTVNTSNAASGQLRFGAADPAGSAAQPIGLAAIRLRAAASGSSALTFTLTDLSAAITFTNLLTRAPAALVLSGAVRVQ